MTELLIGFSAEPMNIGVMNRGPNGCRFAVAAPDGGRGACCVLAVLPDGFTA
jgi:hypothetical protein